MDYTLYQKMTNNGLYALSKDDKQWIVQIIKRCQTVDSTNYQNMKNIGSYKLLKDEKQWIIQIIKRCKAMDHNNCQKMRNNGSNEQWKMISNAMDHTHY